MVSPYYILKSSYSYINACFLVLFNLVVLSHVWLQECLTLLCKIAFRKFKKFVKIQGSSYYIFGHTIILSFLIFNFKPRLFCKIIFNYLFRNIGFFYYGIPDPSIDRLKKRFHSNLPKLIINTHRWFVNRSTFNREKLVLGHFRKNRIRSWILFKNRLLIPIVNIWRLSLRRGELNYHKFLKNFRMNL